MRLTNQPKIFGEVDDKLRRVLNTLWQEMSRVVNNRISFGAPLGPSNPQIKGLENIDGVWATVVTPGVANTEFTITHNLGRVPVGYDVKSKDQAAIIYDSRKALWTKTQLFLKCNTATVTLVLFIH